MTDQQEIAVVTLQARWFGNENYDVYTFSSVAEAQQGVRQYFECPDDVTDFDAWLEYDEDRLHQGMPHRGYYEITTHQTLSPMPPQAQQLHQALSDLVDVVDHAMTGRQSVVTLKMRLYGEEDEVFVYSSEAEAQQGVRQYFDCPDDVSEVDEWLDSEERGYYEIARHSVVLPTLPQLQSTDTNCEPCDLTMRAYYKLMKEGYGEDDVLDHLTDGAYQDVMSRMAIEAVQARLQSFTETQRERLKGVDDEALTCAILYPKELVIILRRSESDITGDDDDWDFTQRVYYAMTQGYGDTEILDDLSDGGYQATLSEMAIEAIQARLELIPADERERLKALDDAGLKDAVLHTTLLLRANKG